MEGKVKWFSKDRGYGFITDEDCQDYYFGVRDVHGDTLPETGETVSFEPKKSPKGWRATQVKVDVREPVGDYRPIKDLHGRVICQSCGALMVPRLVFWHGEVSRSVCPFCGEVYKNFRQIDYDFWIGFALLVAFLMCLSAGDSLFASLALIGLVIKCTRGWTKNKKPLLAGWILPEDLVLFTVLAGCAYGFTPRHPLLALLAALIACAIPIITGYAIRKITDVIRSRLSKKKAANPKVA